MALTEAEQARRITAQLSAAVEGVVRGIAGDVLDDLAQRTPMATGASASSWRATATKNGPVVRRSRSAVARSKAAQGRERGQDSRHRGGSGQGVHRKRAGWNRAVERRQFEARARGIRSTRRFEGGDRRAVAVAGTQAVSAHSVHRERRGAGRCTRAASGREAGSGAWAGRGAVMGRGMSRSRPSPSCLRGRRGKGLCTRFSKMAIR